MKPVEVPLHVVHEEEVGPLGGFQRSLGRAIIELYRRRWMPGTRGQSTMSLLAVSPLSPPRVCGIYLCARMQACIQVTDPSSSVAMIFCLDPMQNSGCDPLPVCRPMTMHTFMAMLAKMVEGSVAKRMLGSGQEHMRMRAWMASRFMMGVDRRVQMSLVRHSATVVSRSGCLE